MEQEETKRCSCCKRVLPLSEFFKRRASPDGIACYCKECNKQKCRAYYRKMKCFPKARMKMYQRRLELAAAATERKHISEKLCRRCGRLLPIDQFHKSKISYDGYGSYCKDCISQYNKERRAKQKQLIWTP